MKLSDHSKHRLRATFTEWGVDELDYIGPTAYNALVEHFGVEE